MTELTFFVKRAMNFPPIWQMLCYYVEEEHHFISKYNLSDLCFNCQVTIKMVNSIVNNFSKLL